MRRLTPVVLAGLLVLLSAVPATAASTRSRIIRDCADDGQLQGTYSPSDVRDARKHLPSDVAEYTDCADVLRRAELPDNGGGGGGGSGNPGAPTGGAAPAPGGAAPPPAPLTPQSEADQQALAQARGSSSQPVTVAGQKLLAGAAPLRDGYRANGLPGSLVIALILLGLAGLALSVPPVRRRLPWHRLTRRRT